MIDSYDLNIKAILLRKQLGIDSNSPIDVLAVLQSIENLTLVFLPMGENLSGLCIKNNKTPIIAINSSMSIGRQRFSMGHELFHLYFEEENHLPVCSINIGTGNEIEQIADQFSSLFLIPPIALKEAIEKFAKNKIGIEEIVSLEQYFGVSRQAILYRLVKENFLTQNESNQYRQNIILSAITFGYDDTLYKPLSDNKKYGTYGYYIKKANQLVEKEIISNSKYEELLLTAFRSDIVYGNDFSEGELID